MVRDWGTCFRKGSPPSPPSSAHSLVAVESTRGYCNAQIGEVRTKELFPCSPKFAMANRFCKMALML